MQGLMRTNSKRQLMYAAMRTHCPFVPVALNPCCSVVISLPKENQEQRRKILLGAAAQVLGQAASCSCFTHRRLQQLGGDMSSTPRGKPAHNGVVIVGKAPPNLFCMPVSGCLA